MKTRWVNQTEPFPSRTCSSSFVTLADTNLRAGNFVEPFSLERNTRKENLSFMERSGATQNFASERAVGVMLYGDLPNYEQLSWYIGGFFGNNRPTTLGQRNVRGTNLDTVNVTGRVAWNPYYDMSDEGFSLLHLGGGASYRRTDDLPGGLGNGDWEGKIPLGGQDALHSIQLSANSEMLIWNAEFAAAYGPFSLQGEYYQAQSDLDNTDGELSISGFYVQGSWFVTGEHRDYDPRMNSWSGVRVHNPVFTYDGMGTGFGALELVARYDFTDLDSVPALLAVGGDVVPPTVIGTWISGS